MGFTTPLPLPAEQGILINFGDEPMGSGSVEPRPVEKVVKKPPVSKPEPQAKTTEQTYQTQDYEEAPEVTAKKTTPKKTATKNNVKEQPKEKPKEEPKKVDARALWGKNRNTKTNNSEGVNGGNGNQGDPAGEVSSTNRSIGTGVGNGISFSLNGRSAVNLPSPRTDLQKEGTVVVRITVDRNGKVTNAEPGVKGSTILDGELLEIARKAALASKFNTKDNAPMYQQGTITYVFRLR
jgi:TonB family protein